MQTPHKQIHSPRGTHPFVWCAAIVCTFCSILVILTGVVVFIGYLAIRPKVPYVSVTAAHLDTFDATQGGVLNVQLSLRFKAENDNLQAHASFSEWYYQLKFHGVKIATLRNSKFDVDKNATRVFYYVVKSDSLPLDPDLTDVVNLSIARNQIVFNLAGSTRTRWRVGPIKSVKFWLHLNCVLKFQVDGTSIDSHCSSRSK